MRFGHDIWGNLHAKNQIAGKQQGEYFQQTMNAQNRFAGWSYDAAGNLLNDGAHSYAYDPDGRIKTMDSGVGSYVYSAQGRRVKKTVNGVTTQYANDGPDGPVVTEFVGGAWSKDYIYLNGALLATESTTEGTRFHFSDHLGTPRVITDAVGTVISRHDYYPYGRELTPSSDNETHKFTGKERDTESSLDYFIARYYSSAQGRFLSPDEFVGGPVDALSSSDPLPPGPLPYADITDPQSLNKYTYTFNNPLRYTDPNGHDVWDFLSGIGNATRSNAVVGLGRQEGNSDFELGQRVGDAISVLGGAIEMLGGSTMAGGGAAACVTGAGCLAGAPVAVAGVAVAAHGATMAGTAISNIIQKNPYGSRGAPDHQQTAAEEATKLGPTGDREVTIKTPGGEKGFRRADAARRDPNTGKVTKPAQVYRPTKTGQIPPREQSAARDIQKATGQKPKMVPVRPLKKPEGER